MFVVIVAEGGSECGKALKETIMSSETYSGTTVGQNGTIEGSAEEEEEEESLVERAARGRSNHGRRVRGSAQTRRRADLEPQTDVPTGKHVTQGETITSPIPSVEGESGVGRDSIDLDMRESDDGGLTSPVAAEVASDQIMAQIGTMNGESMVPSKSREMDAETEQGEREVFMGNFDFAETDEEPYDWACSFDEQNRTLEQEERAAGVKAEFERHRETAHEAHEQGLNREQAEAEAVQWLAASWMDEPHGTNVEEVREEMSPRVDSEKFVRENVSPALVDGVREEAERLAKKYETSGPMWSIAKRLVKRVQNDGKEFDVAVFEEREAIKAQRPIQGQRQFVEDVDQYQWEATIEGEVKVLWEPNDPMSQQQVGIIDDGTGEVKVTVWNNSFKSTLMREGETVRIENGKPGRYNGRLTLAVDGDAEIYRVERSDGECTRGTRRVSHAQGRDFEQPKQSEIQRRQLYRDRSGYREFSANPEKRYERAPY